MHGESGVTVSDRRQEPVSGAGDKPGSRFLRRVRTISELFINEQIRDREVRLIGEDGAQLGIMSSREALKIAEEAGLDLVKIAPTAKASGL